jgi:hypothetical protein
MGEFPMNRSPKRLPALFAIGIVAVSLTGCVELLGAAGTGAYVAAEYALTGAVRKTMCYDFQCTKEALLVALCRMGITAERAEEIEKGEEIVASAPELEIRIELEAVTAKATRVSVSAGKSFLDRDKATAQEIVSQTQMIAEQMVTVRHGRASLSS